MKSTDVLFNLDQFGGTDVITEWLTIADTYAAALSRVMISRYSDAVYTSDLLLNAVAALEGYHRDRFEGGKRFTTTLVKRIDDCIKHAGPVFDDLAADARTFAELLKDGRHAVAHHLDGMEAPTQHLFLARAASWLLILCLFRDADVPGALSETIKEAQDWWWLRGHLKQVLGDAAATGAERAQPRPPQR